MEYACNILISLIIVRIWKHLDSTQISMKYIFIFASKPSAKKVATIVPTAFSNAFDEWILWYFDQNLKKFS